MPTVRQATREQALAFRLDSHQLARHRPLGQMLDAAGACGVRNTPPGSAPLALNARVAAFTPDDLDTALGEKKSLVEVLGMRVSPVIVPTRDATVFTLGALPADEASFRVAMLNPPKAVADGSISASDALEQAADAARAALDGTMLTRGALSQAITRRLPAGLSPWCRGCKSDHVQETLFRLVGVRGVFAIARIGKQNLYVRTDQWLSTQQRGKAPTGDLDVARAELLRRYLRCFGPSTVSHFAAWVGIAVDDARRAWDALGDRLVEMKLQGRRAWLHAGDLERFESPPKATGARLLPPYDAYLDQRDRETLLPEKALHRRVWTVLGNPGVVLVDAQLVGIWRPQKKGKRLGLAVQVFSTLSKKARDEIEAEAALLAPHRGCTSAEVTFAD